MGQVTSPQGNQRAAHQGHALVCDFLPEAAAQTQKGIGQDVVQQAHQHGVAQHGAVAEITRLKSGGDRIRAQGHLHQCIGKACGQAPLHSVAVGRQNNGQHTHQGQLAAEGHGRNDGASHQFQHHRHGNEHGAFGNLFGFGFHRNTP